MDRKIIMNRSTYIEFLLDVIIPSSCEELPGIDWPLVNCVFSVIIHNGWAYNIMYQLL